MSPLRPNRVPYPIPQPNNMGTVRYVLAIGVLIAHFQLLAGTDFWFPLTSYSCVGGFFALSGFLIYGSYLKHSDPKGYVLSRARRLLPAYWGCVLVCALALVSVSSLTPTEYFLSPQFWKYLIANFAFLNFIEPALPGVFTGNPMDAVNASLWTMKVEWLLYLSVPVVYWIIRKTRQRPVTIFVAVFILSCLYRELFGWLLERTGNSIYEILGRQVLGQMAYFYIGVLAYYWFDVLMRYKWWVIAVSAAVVIVGYDIPGYGIWIHPVAVSLLVIMASMVGHWAPSIGRNDNISYNIYLMHFPVIQVIVWAGLPAWFASVCPGYGWAVTLTLGTAIAATAVVSWLLLQWEYLFRPRRK